MKIAVSKIIIIDHNGNKDHGNHLLEVIAVIIRIIIVSIVLIMLTGNHKSVIVSIA